MEERTTMEHIELPRNFGYNISNFQSSLTQVFEPSFEDSLLSIKWKSNVGQDAMPALSEETIGEKVSAQGKYTANGHVRIESNTDTKAEGSFAMQTINSEKVLNTVANNESRENNDNVMTDSGDHTVNTTPQIEPNDSDIPKQLATDSPLAIDSCAKNQLEATLDWLDTNYERADGVCLPRCVLYTHYLDLCKRRGFTPAGAATFGKIIRQRFPKLTTRRLGTRGQSKYHYYGIGVKETSIYYQSVYSGKGLTRFSGTKVKTEGSNRKYSLSSKTGTLLPDFPKAADLILDNLDNDLEQDKVQTFIVMYRTHCQRILDTIIGANFEEVQNFLLHFWQGMPEHLVDLLNEQLITDLIGFCDSTLYKVLLDVLIPTTIQDLPDSLTAEIKIFIRRLPVWMNNSLEDSPEKLRKKKLEMVQHFTRCMKRHISFVHLAQTSRNMLQDGDTSDQMIDDLQQVEFDRVCLQVAYIQPELFHNTSEKIKKYFGEFTELLKKQSPIEVFTEWIDNVVDVRVIDHNKLGGRLLKEEASRFMLHWSIFSTLLLRDLTLCNAKSFGSFHLLYMTFNEYIFLIMETQQANVREEEQRKHMHKFIRNADDISMKPKSRNENSNSSGKAKRKKDSFNECSSDVPEISTCQAKTLSTSYSKSPELDQQDDPTPPLSSSSTDTRTNSQPEHPSSNSCYPVPLKDLQSSLSIATSSAPHTQTVIKPTPSMASGNSYASSTNNGSYFPHVQVGFGVSPYPTDYLSTTGSSNPSPLSSLPSPVQRIQHQLESLSQEQVHQSVAGSIPGNCLSMVPGPGTHGVSYWSDYAGPRSHTGYSDGHPYNISMQAKHHQAYETYGRSSGAFMRADSIQSPRSAFDSTRSFYSRSTENYPTAGTFCMTSYGNNMNYMEVAPPSGQFTRPDANIFNNHQQEAHEFYTSYASCSTSPYSKSYVTPFR